METPFYLNLVQDNTAIKKGRAKTLANQAMRAKAQILTTCINNLEQAKFKLEKLNDLSPDTSVSLKYRDDFDPDKWAAETHEVEMEIGVLQMEYEIAVTSYEKHFGKLVHTIPGSDETKE